MKKKRLKVVRERFMSFRGVVGWWCSGGGAPARLALRTEGQQDGQYIISSSSIILQDVYLNAFNLHDTKKTWNDRFWKSTCTLPSSGHLHGTAVKSFFVFVFLFWFLGATTCETDQTVAYLNRGSCELLFLIFSFRCAHLKSDYLNIGQFRVFQLKGYLIIALISLFCPHFIL